MNLGHVLGKNCREKSICLGFPPNSFCCAFSCQEQASPIPLELWTLYGQGWDLFISFTPMLSHVPSLEQVHAAIVELCWTGCWGKEKREVGAPPRKTAEGEQRISPSEEHNHQKGSNGEREKAHHFPFQTNRKAFSLRGNGTVTIKMAAFKFFPLPKI